MSPASMTQRHGASALRWLACAVAVRALACSRPVSVSVELDLDVFSCGGVGPMEIPIGCGGSVAIYAIDSSTFEVDERCVELPVQLGVPLAELEDILSDEPDAWIADLPEGLAILVDLAIYPPGDAECPAPLELAMEEAAIYGRTTTPPVLLEGRSVRIPVLLRCMPGRVPCP